MATWHCVVCGIDPNVIKNTVNTGYPSNPNFSSVKEFCEHLKSFHVLVKNTNGSSIYICCYGPAGKCCIQGSDPSPDLATGFTSLREYERHLVSRHLKQQTATTMYANGPLKALADPAISPPSSRWSVYNSVVNLPAVLNDPTYRQTDIFARTWGEQFERAEVLPSPQLPLVTEKDFERYLHKLRKTGVLNDPFPTKNRTDLTENAVLKAVRGVTPARRFPSVNQNTTSQGPIITRSDSLSSIPSMFFESEFDLRQTGTFSRVIPLHPRKSQSGVSNVTSFANSFDADDESLIQAAGGRQERDFRTQHERLTHYLDIVEVHLADQVSRKSSIFFEAVCCHDVVQEQLSSALDHIKLVRAKLGQVDSSITCGVMRLHRVIRRKANYRLLLEKLKIIASLQTAQPTIQLLLRGSDFCAALDLVSSTQELLLQFTPNNLGLSTDCNPSDSQPASSAGRQLTCLRHLHAQLVEISRFVRHMIEADFEAALQQFLESRSDRNQYGGPDLIPCLLGLLYIKRHDFVSAFRAELLRQIKLLQTSRPGSTTGEMTSSLKEQLRTMSNPNWIDFLAKKCSDLRDLLSRAKEASDIFSQTIMRSVTITPRESHPMATPLPEQTARELQQQLSVAMQTACGAAQKHIIDIISLRSRLTLNEPSPSTTFPRASSSDAATRSNDILTKPVTAGESALNRLSSEEFVRLVTLLQDFQTFLLRLSEKTEFPSVPPAKTTDQQGMLKTSDDSVSNPTTALARLLLTLTRNSLQRFHQEHTTKLDMILNQERWHAIPVPSRVQNLVTHTFVNALRNTTKVCLDSCSPPSSDTTASLSTDRHRQHFTSDDSVSTTLNFDGERFVVVGTVLLLLPMMADYVNLAPRLPCRPGSIAELASRLAELLNSFNSRTCQLVLGAEARKSADLPTISARNLALASRSVQLIARCVPPLQAYFTNLQKEESKNGQMLHPLYAVPKDKRQHDPLLHMENLFREHVDQISDKLYSLLSSRIQDRLCAWNVRPPTPSPEIRAICRALTRMVEMISDVMPIDMLQPIIFRAHVEFKTQLHHRLRELNITADGGPMQSLVDQELKFYASQLRSLTPELSKFEEDFSDVWPST